MTINPENIRIEDFSYDLPDERIAKYPLDKRDSSNLLVYKQGNIQKKKFNDIQELINSSSTLIFNNTKVIQARLAFQKETGAQIEIFCLEPIEPAEYNLAFQETKSLKWKCIVGNSKKWKQGILSKYIKVEGNEIELIAKRLESGRESNIIEFSWNNENITFSQILETTGVTPIPPYLNRETEELDKNRYQTVYSKLKGSVAAPTAGLHFTDEILKNLEQKGVSINEVTLHVGAGTFKPVKSETIDDHEMHTEHFVVSKSIIKNLLSAEKNIVVGTTSVRTLESLYWIGAKLVMENELTSHINQWEAYKLGYGLSKKEALSSLINYLDDNNLEELHASTQIMIYPGYKFKMVDALITNFHQPKSTLLLLISAFIGDNWKKVYDFALENDFRFLSYGDSSILIP